MEISVENKRANFSSVTDSDPFRSALLIFLMDCGKRKYLFIQLDNYLTQAEKPREVHTIFLKVAHVLLLDVLCSRMAVLLISSPTLSLERTEKSVPAHTSNPFCSIYLNSFTYLSFWGFKTPKEIINRTNQKINALLPLGYIKWGKKC